MAAKCSTALGLAALLTLGCDQHPVDIAIEPLVDENHQPDVLVESRSLTPPPDFGGNRFVRGWFPWKDAGDKVLVPAAEGAVVEVTHLSARPRILQLETRTLGKPGDFIVEVEIDGRVRERVPLAATVRVPLPADLPLGRVPIRLWFPKSPDPIVLAATLDSALPPGDVVVEPNRITQSPDSLVEFVRPTVAKARLKGRFEPPSDSGPGVRYAIELDHGEGTTETLFEWRGGWLDRLRGSRELSLPLAGQSEFLRLRLVARGSAEPAVWHDLRLEHETDSHQWPTSAPPTAPRVIVLYVLDALRADFVDLSPSPDNPTPTLRRIASEGVVFERHASVAPNTMPSTKSLFTGRTYRTGGHWKLPESGPQTLAEAFVEAGYRTAAFSGNQYVSESFGTARGFEHLASEVVFRGYKDSPEAFNDNAARVQRSALAWLDRISSDDKVFLYLHTIHPHNPYDPPEEIARRLTAGIDSEISGSTPTLLDIQHNRRDVTTSDENRLRELYRGTLSYNDRQIAQFLTELRRRYPDPEILLIVTSDHGEELFDHGGVLHGYTLYREQLRIPLLLWWPSRLAPQRVGVGTDSLDLHESLRALIGARPSTAAEGRPFWNLLGSEAHETNPYALQFGAASSVKGGIYMARSARYKLILAPRVGRSFGMGEGRGRTRDPEYLFDLLEDAGETVNRAGSGSLEVAWLRSRLKAWIEHGESLSPEAAEPELDDEERARLRALGYLD